MVRCIFARERERESQDNCRSRGRLSTLFVRRVVAQTPRKGGAFARPSLEKTFNINGLRMLGGAEGNRTPDLIIANDALYQLSYSPAFVSAH